MCALGLLTGLSGSSIDGNRTRNRTTDDRSRTSRRDGTKIVTIGSNDNNRWLGRLAVTLRIRSTPIARIGLDIRFVTRVEIGTDWDSCRRLLGWYVNRRRGITLVRKALHHYILCFYRCW